MKLELYKRGLPEPRRVGGIASVVGVSDTSVQVASGTLIALGVLSVTRDKPKTGATLGVLGLLGFLFAGDSSGDGEDEDLFDDVDLSGVADPRHWTVLVLPGNQVRFPDGTLMPANDFVALVAPIDTVGLAASGAARHGDVEAIRDALDAIGADIQDRTPGVV